MDDSDCELRRATLDDLDALRALWRTAGLDSATLDPRLTEFQIAVSTEGQVLAALGLYVEGQQGWLHNEAYANALEPGSWRARLWERVLTVAKNRGLRQLWVSGTTGKAWEAIGFRSAGAEALAQLPASFGGRDLSWWILPLAAPGAVSLDHEFELFVQSQKEITGRAFQQARVVRGLAVVILIVAMGGFVVFVWNALSKISRKKRRK